MDVCTCTITLSSVKPLVIGAEKSSYPDFGVTNDNI